MNQQMEVALQLVQPTHRASPFIGINTNNRPGSRFRQVRSQSEITNYSIVHLADGELFDPMLDPGRIVPA
jgi:hypothetical protein